MFTVFLGSLVSLVVCMALGFLCRRIKLLDDSLISGLTVLLVKVTLPCTIFISLMRPFSQQLLSESLGTFLLSGAAYLLGGLFGWPLAKWLKPDAEEKQVFFFSLIFANVGYMGFPVTQAVFGGDGMLYASMANAAFNLLAYTLGIWIFNPTPDLRATAKLLVNPALVTTLVGFVFFVTQLRLPAPVQDGIGMVADMTTPISMIIVGAILAKNPLRDLVTDWRVLPVIAVRLAVVPVIAFLLLKPFVKNDNMLGVIVVLAAMPVASLTAIFAERYRRGAAMASRLVALSTLLSVAVVPLLALGLGII